MDLTRPGIDPGTFRLVAQSLNHYATPGPFPASTSLTEVEPRAFSAKTKCTVSVSRIIWRKIPLGRSTHKWEDIIKMGLNITCSEDINLFHLIQYTVERRAFYSTPIKNFERVLTLAFGLSKNTKTFRKLLLFLLIKRTPEKKPPLQKSPPPFTQDVSSSWNTITSTRLHIQAMLRTDWTFRESPDLRLVSQ